MQKVKIVTDVNFIQSKLIKVNGVYIHHTAEVSPESTIGINTRIWNNAQVRENSVIGENSIIGKDVYIDIGVKIGNRVKIQNGVSVYRGVTIGDDVFLGPHMTFTNDLYPRAFVSDFDLFPTMVENGVSIGANSTIVCGVTIHKFAMVGAGSVVTRDVPAFALVFGTPARIRGWVSKRGKKLKFNTDGIACCEIDGSRYIKRAENLVEEI